MAGLRGKSLGGFRILEQIDEESGQGIVCKAVCEVENPSVAVLKGQVVALKVMPVHDDPNGQQWRKLESRTKQLSQIDHPNVVRYYGCFCEQGEWNQLHVIVQEFLEGETLKDKMQRFPSGLDVDLALKIVDLALEGLAHTSSRGIIHRDIKPGNIFICEKDVNGRKDFSVKLIDFEVAKQGQGSTTASTGNLRGSFNYMAPEFLDARFSGDLLSDIFSMGVTLHESLTGKLPYDFIEGNGEDAILDFVARWKGFSDGRNPIVVSPDVNRLLAHTETVFSGCLSPIREQRFGSFEEFRKALKNVRFRTLTNPASGRSYQMLQFVGKGGFGEVFKARESRSGQIVAVKHLRKLKYADRFKREAKILSKLSGDCFVRFVESFSRDMDGKVQEFLVMGFLKGMPGNSLSDAIKKSKGGGLPKKDVLTAFVRYAQGLRMLHTAGIFHRDIKPSNLYYPVSRPDLAVIMDLGIARDTKGTLTVGSIPGTPDYMPPEVVTAGSRGESGMDIYALGLCLYEALTAKQAFPRLSPGIEGLRKLVERVNNKVQPNLDDERLDREIIDLLSDMIAFKPEDRINDVRIVERRLRELLAKLDPRSEPVLKTGGYYKTGQSAKWVLRLAVIAGLGALVWGLSVFVAFPLIKKYYAKKRLADVLDSYRRFDLSAEDKENAWIVEFNPESYSRLRLEEPMFIKCTNEINAVKCQVLEKKDRKDWLKRIDRCILNNGKLDVNAYGELSSWDLPDKFEDDSQIKSKIDDLKRNVNDELAVCLAVGDVKTRRRRLKIAGEILANTWTVRILNADELSRLKKTFDDAAVMCAGNVHNSSGGVIEAAGVKIGPGETKLVIIRDGRPQRHFVTRQGYKSIPLPTGFDAMDFKVDDTTFVIKPVKISIPELSEGLCFVLLGVEYAGGETVELTPGSYIGRYVRNDKTPTGDKMYKDFVVEFSVTPAADVKIPKHGLWEYTDLYRKFLVSPVDVEIPKLEYGVRCRIDGKAAVAGKTSFLPGRHLCIYEKDDCFSQTNSFEIFPGKNFVLSGPLDWRTTKDVERLRGASKLAEQKQWNEVEKAIKGINVSASENVEELNRLKDGVDNWKKDEEARIEKVRKETEKRKAEKKRELKAKIEKLLEIEPVEGRRKRLSAAKDLLEGYETRKILEESEIEKLGNDVSEAMRLTIGRIRNSGDFVFSVNGVDLEPGRSHVIKYDNRQSQGVVVKASGYEDLILGKELDETEVAISNNQWTMADVAVKIGPMVDGVECLFNGRHMKSNFKVKPGDYELLFRRNGYEPHVVSFTALFLEGCTVRPPQKWTPLPVEISLPELEDGVRCFLGHSEVRRSVRLLPGRSYEFCYKKDDCVDQRVKLYVEAGTPSNVPMPSFWVDTEDVGKLSEAERCIKDGKLEEAAKLLEKIILQTSANKKRMELLKGDLDKALLKRREEQEREEAKRKREAVVKDFIEKAELAYTPEDLLGGSARDCIQGYYGAVANGYVLNAQDRQRIKHCYDVGLRDLKDQRRSVDNQLKKGVRPFRNPKDIDKDAKQLNEWYNLLRK